MVLIPLYCYTGIVSVLAGSIAAGYIDGTGTVAKFSNPIGVSVDSTGNVLVADTYNQMIRKINLAGKYKCIADVT